MQADQDQINRMLAGTDTTHAEVIQVRLETLWFVHTFITVWVMNVGLIFELSADRYGRGTCGDAIVSGITTTGCC